MSEIEGLAPRFLLPEEDMSEVRRAVSRILELYDEILSPKPEASNTTEQDPQQQEEPYTNPC